MSRPLFVAALVAAAASSMPRAARAEDEIVLRGNYWRDRNTRIFAPQAGIRKEYARTRTTVEADYLLDAITSASVSAGVLTDQPFTELRNEAGARVGQKLGPANLGVLYRYSTESDYWSHTGGVTGSVELLQKNLTLSTAYVYTRSEVGQRAGPTGYFWAAPSRKREDSQLNQHFFMLSGAQTLSRRLLLEASYELFVLKGYQSNPYRRVVVAGNPLAERVPTERHRHALTAGLRVNAVHRKGSLEQLTFYLKYRFYIDSWGITSHTPEVRAYAELGPVGLRFTASYYWQSAAAFYHSGVNERTLDGALSRYDLPAYDTPVSQSPEGAPLPYCASIEGCYTGDAKLASQQGVFVEGRIEYTPSFLGRVQSPFGRYMARSRIGVSFGQHITKIPGRYARGVDEAIAPAPYGQFGNAWVGALDLRLPL